VVDGVEAEVTALAGAIDAHLADGGRGERLRDGLAVAIVGAPNAGKSSLLNALAGRDAAIVSSRAGTTRDVVEVRLDLRGIPVTLADTAGLRETEDEVEAEGVRRALARAEAADLRLAVFDGAAGPDAATLALVDADAVPVWNKLDLVGWAPAEIADRPASAVSAATGQGIDALLTRLGEEAERRVGASETPALTRARHRRALEEARDALRRSLGAGLPELAAEDLRLAVRALGRITGRVDVEDLLDVIFRDFCIGK
jgi:tRNA modification GTPase